ncbi:hypothetical protein B5C34_11140 [Pacificimonas flava]|uniref:HPr-rel-A system PqqD family protein n=2 Tax=Pacificimonas TaxID=1960290 RepID=A0A219B6Q6_9SPHN|nr:MULTISPECIES: HPr-rel-A system PqqD family peptide chaperone [Pacificimonas]MBZ6378777.1 HPr-rel-A system PqqD family peptide chaperone [Pacificimonas aurantium]OWV33961.1 hypothetical protein B5C34_11140 [Pacificimonas flava]
MRYRLRADEVRIEPLAGLTLAHQRLSGETHVLSEETAAILDALPERGGSPAEIGRILTERFEIVEAEDVGLTGSIESRLEELRALGLVERA